MRIIKITVLLILSLSITAHAQDKANKNDQTRTVEINNDNGNLFISFLNGKVVEFTVNDEEIAKDRYDEYQEIMDDFSDEDIEPVIPPTPIQSIEFQEDENANLMGDLRELMVSYLEENNGLKSSKKFNIELNSEQLEINGKTASDELHQSCLDLFNKIYEYPFDENIQLKYAKSKNKSKSSLKVKETR